MPMFAYRGRNARGDLLQGRIESPNAQAVAVWMSAVGITPVAINQSKMPTQAPKWLTDLFTEKKLSDALASAQKGDTEARAVVMSECKKLGRFAEPALRKLMVVGKSNWALYDAALKAANGNG